MGKTNVAGTYDVTLKAGANALMVEYRHDLGPVETSVSVAGADQPVMTMVAPVASLSASANGQRLTLKMPAGTERGGDFAVDRVSAILPVKRWTVHPSAMLSIDVSQWPDGPYRFNVHSSHPEGGVGHAESLIWYKGDAKAAAQAMVNSTTASGKGVQAAYARWLKDRLRAALGADMTAADLSDRLAPILMESEAIANQSPVSTRFVRLAYPDAVDGSTQFCRVYLPSSYEQTDKWPAVVSLHGFNPDNPDYANWWSADATYNPSADRYGVIWIEPHGRGNAQYTGMGEADVLRCLSLAQQRLKIDRDRTYLTGESMGGSGTWLVASRHPDLFAAIAPNFGGWDFRIAPSFGYDLTRARTDWPSERFFLETQSSFQGIESLLHVPVIVNHGGSDPVMPVAYSRHAVGLLQTWGYDVRYWEHPGGTHSNLDQYDVVIPWLLQHRRVTNPAEIRIRSRDLAGASAYWLTVDRSERPLEIIRVEARLEAPGVLRINSSNVASLHMTPPAAFYDAAHRLSIVWNDVEVSAIPDAAGVIHAGQTDRGSFVKRAGMEGGLSDVLKTPFMLVVGTQSPDPGMRRMIAGKAETFAALWREWQHEPIRIKLDTDVTPEDEAQYSLMLLGGPAENKVAKQWASRLPFSIGPGGITVADQAIPANDAVLQLIYPSPAANNRYVFVVAPTSEAGMYFWNAGGLWQRPFGASFVPLDWTVQDGLRVDLPRGMAAERAYVASGVFDEHWQARNDLIFMGDQTARKDGSLRAEGQNDGEGDGVAFADYKGTYAFFPGFAATVAESEGRLTMITPGLAPLTLVPERKDEFGARESSTSLVFRRDATGRIDGVDIFSGAPKAFAKRVP
ncbi:MAG: prolyl oligopeptidase family serine peptidase [Asticcacaulis sp.]